MAHFTIHLPDHSEWDIRSGQVFKKTFGFFKKKKAEDSRKGYVVICKSNQKQYRFLKTPEGNWSDKSEAGFGNSNDETSILIKKQIDEFEKILKSNSI